MTEFDDWRAICELKARYCRCLDTKDWAGYAAVFTDDVVIDTTAAGGPRFEGRDIAVAGVRAAVERAITTHHVHNPEILVDGDTATAIWAMQDRNIWPEGRALLGFGHYHERYVRTDGKWRIAESRLTRLHIDYVGDGSTPT
ncbi:nuclear transport factor 2 family protein [Sphingomonas sp. SUN039]|uniref:nuclear transport factor 2 family protein n=1 Tax=Sphingomonas sp. SUN039 TaxID=2937787 RepID=UPI0021649D69|nr:nuclear transport factor 2 family protein [Sphingomonas sp. SUN039]UVO52660.1 nuclear transport factor 2 family protein [Sphingomonas sp. SUN039]